MKAPLKNRRPSPEETLAIVSQAAPNQPPAKVVQAFQLEPVEGKADPRTTLSLRVRQSTIAAIEAAAREQGLTLKQIVTQALQAVGVQVAPADLEDRTPRRKT